MGGLDMAPHTPTLRAPAEPWRFASVVVTYGPSDGPPNPPGRLGTPRGGRGAPRDSDGLLAPGRFLNADLSPTPPGRSHGPG